MRVNLKTLGCRLNEAELETWAQQLLAEGHSLVADARDADLVVLNSCAVTQDAVRKSRQLVRRSHRENPSAKLVVSGCYATLNRDEAAQSLGVDLVVDNRDKARLLEIVKENLDIHAMPAFSSEPGESALFMRGRQRAFVKVQDGCRYRCTFCIVTVARGEERSRAVPDVVEEVRRLHEQGIQEVILTGVHLGGWGSDLGMRLDQLIAAVLEQTEIPRLRLGSLEPWELSEDFFALLGNPRFMPHLHLPLQSGADSVLRRMARRCKTAEFEALVRMARQAAPDLNITTDIIVGFPGESESEWQESLSFIERMGFGHIHVFSYSPREGTKAATLPDPIASQVKKARSQALHALAQRQKQETLSRHLGRRMAVLWEESRGSDSEGRHRYFGYTPNYLRVETTVPEGSELSNTIAEARLIALAPGGEHVCAVALPESA
ncbi:tRNA (N(6)-L-threonylcarbamoyladenosine(37)-C(2))-methylthiotransferase MtaB [Methyloterricola oryzae]|uniref:tRNA (N(6)-L-threonylcarbamoyladenosine(37)-C(2))- methylthiotransferase MtaB n=1 Tax=Methyloterricola oryzae TaxID=1495050 RepID=UPI0005EBE49A|nr:tRNA (N(6)-L-threonylcarbamoyladenosine(37)-C(2))-methylthiotransferase MtaB [Methyloterricola oryzae]